MPNIKLKNLEYNDVVITAHFTMFKNVNAPKAHFDEILVCFSGQVIFPSDTEDVFQKDASREAHAQLLEHLESFVEELRKKLS